ncbi:MAG: TonB-dependent receptor, partial [Gemmatimonadaceae bacterium]
MLCALAAFLTPLATPAQPSSTTLSASAHALAQPTARTAAPDSTDRYRFDIPAQPLRDALAALGRQAGLRVVLRGTPSGIESRPVTGTLTAQAALRILLAGTGHRARFEDAESIVVSKAATRDSVAHELTPVVVMGDATRRAGYTARRTATATKTDVPLRDVPQAVTVLGRELIEDQSMQNMTDVTRYIPGISMGQGEGHRDAPTIRGNSSTSDFFVDGVRDDAQYLRDLYNVERVEALKGSNAMIFGRGGGGGVINRVTKEAGWAPTRDVTLEGGSFDHKRATVDIGDGVGPGFAVRLNGMFEDSRQFRDATSLERYGVNPAAAILAGGTLVRLGYEYFADRRTVNRGIPSFQGRPSGADITTFFGDPDASRSRAVVHSAGATIERGSVSGLLLRNRTRFVTYDKYYQNVFPGALNATGTQVSLNAYNNATYRRNLFNQTDVTYALGAGSIRHTLLVGAELGRQVSENYRETGYFNDATTSLAVPFEDPTISAPITFRQSATDADNEVTANIVGVYAQNQVELGSHWQAVVGLRYDRFDLDFHNNRNDQDLQRKDDMLSPRAGLLFKPTERISLYGAYSIAHLPSSGDQFASLTATTQTIEPERFTNRELGIKWDLGAGLALTAAVYRLDRTNTSAPDPADPTRVVQTGAQRTTGVETGLSGYLTSRWQVAGGYARQRARIVRRTSAAREGVTVPLVPEHTLSLWNRYQVTRRFGAGLGVVHQADMFAAIDNAVTLPAFTRLDAAAYVTLSDRLRAQLNVENLLDERYYATSHGNDNIMPGASRTLRVSVTATP